MWENDVRSHHHHHWLRLRSRICRLAMIRDVHVWFLLHLSWCAHRRENLCSLSELVTFWCRHYLFHYLIHSFTGHSMLMSWMKRHLMHQPYGSDEIWSSHFRSFWLSHCNSSPNVSIKPIMQHLYRLSDHLIKQRDILKSHFRQRYSSI